VRCVLIAAAFTCLAGCGYVGDPKPPALEIPTPVTDLRALQYGDKVLVNFTLPPLTTESLQLTSVRSIELRVSGAGAEKTLNVPPKEPGAFEYDFPSAEWSGKQITLTVRATGPKGKTSVWSNEARLTVEAPLAAPANVKVENAPKGVRLSWQGAGPMYRVFRSSGDASPAAVGDTRTTGYVDPTAVNGTSYRYFVQTLSGEAHQSEVSQVVEITPQDEFPPAVPPP